MTGLHVVPASLRPPAILVQVESRHRRLYEALIRRGFVLYGYPHQGASMLQAMGVPIAPVDLAAPFSAEGEVLARARAATLSQRIQRYARSGELAQHLPPESERELAAMQRALEVAIPQAAYKEAVVAGAFDAFASTVDLRLVLARDENSFPTHGIVLAARRRGISSINLMHGMPWAPTATARVRADVVAAYGEWVAEWYAQNGNPAERVAITGNPAWDHYTESAALSDPSEVRRSLGLDPHQPLIMCATTILGGDRPADYIYPGWHIQLFLEALRALGEINRRWPIQVLLKFHPADPRPDRNEIYFAAARQAGLSPVAVGEWVDVRHLAASDLVICADSTLGIEAMLVDRPVINLQLGQLLPCALFDDLDGVINVRHVQDLTGAIESALLDGETQKVLAERRRFSSYRYNYLNDDQAMERVLGLADMVLIGADQPIPAPDTLAPLIVRPAEDTRAAVGQQHLTRANRLLEAGRTLDAEYIAGRAVSFLDNPAPAEFLRGVALLQSGSLPESLARFDAAIIADPEDANLHNGRAGVLHELGRTLDAESSLRRALALHPDNLDSLANLGELLLMRDQRVEAAVHLERARTLAPDDPQVHDLLARALK